MPVKPIPDGYHSLTPYLLITGAARAIDFYKNVFGAIETKRYDDSSGHILHAEITIGDSVLMLSDEYPEMGFKSPHSIGGASVLTMVYLEDVDACFARALAAGATEKQALKDQFYGDRTGTFVDPFGHLWTVATHIEDVSPQEMARRMEEMMKKQASV
ncbi:MAG TPA: VOC family protein [Candidatus Eisenbacteria bacterium]|nr:VOC family protein [Candidatus Eisenbacteria bacterium]